MSAKKLNDGSQIVVSRSISKKMNLGRGGGSVCVWRVVFMCLYLYCEIRPLSFSFSNSPPFLQTCTVEDVVGTFPTQPACVFDSLPPRVRTVCRVARTVLTRKEALL